MRDIFAFFGGRVEAQASGNQIEQFINLLYRYHIPRAHPAAPEDGRRFL